ncbi:MAG: UvrD-helicase domain-containing protein, partial [Lachnospiraceae bacterium]|nr:UvrD-helicase domain-containing protein [Lachnospiraceae bacterium]
MKYTREQQAAIAMRGRDILVSAAAGSGKTAVLANRIVDIVADTDDPVDIDRLLVLTFTNLAAGEMRERIGKLLGERLDADPENAHLQKQATLLYNAQITTIDSFCLYILRNHFQAIGLDPGFRVADEGELKLLYQDVMGAMLEDCYERGEPGFLACVEYFTTGNNDR